MIEYLAERTAQHIKHMVPHHPSSIAVLKYGLSIVINITFIILVTMLLSTLLGTFHPAMIIMFSFALLRQLTGGYHLKTGMGCVAFSSLLFVTLSMMTLPTIYCIILTCMSIILILFYAPSHLANHSRISETYYPLLKIAGCFLVAINLYVLSVPVALAFFVQSVSLIRRR
ncbi:accessory gene regulator ArgB-like protein [Paenibacillus sp. WLX1005]|uniref:accessory gene regulator ArgB-like protein n=1 Tax=Paenibacillus sp. WLX1005 TaxID=3243766 RepID=UPI0039845C58